MDPLLCSAQCCCRAPKPLLLASPFTSCSNLAQSNLKRLMENDTGWMCEILSTYFQSRDPFTVAISVKYVSIWTALTERMCKRAFRIEFSNECNFLADSFSATWVRFHSARRRQKRRQQNLKRLNLVWRRRRLSAKRQGRFLMVSFSYYLFHDITCLSPF